MIGGTTAPVLATPWRAGLMSAGDKAYLNNAAQIGGSPTFATSTFGSYTLAPSNGAVVRAFGMLTASFVSNFSAVAPGTGQGQAVGLDFYPTFVGTGDNGPRRAAAIRARFAGGIWGTETLDFCVGNGGSANDTGGVPATIWSLSGTGVSPAPLPVSQGGTGATTPAGVLSSIGAGAAIDTATNTQNILYMGLLIAALRNVPTGLVDGILDPYSSTADINGAKSSGYTFSSSGGTIGATAADTYTKLLMHFDASPFTDDVGHSVTSSGSPAANTSTTKFGTASLYLNGSSYLNIAQTASEFNFTSGGSWTIEHWLYVASWPSNQMEIWSTNGFHLYWKNGTLNFDNGSSALIAASSAPSAGAWHKIEIDSNSGQITMYIDGVNVGSASAQSWATGSQIWLGCYQGGTSTAMLTGYIDEFRVSQGVARHTSNYTPETNAFTYSVGPALQSTSYAIASSSLNGYPASNAFDGNTSTLWGSSETGTGISGVSHIGQDFGAGNAQVVATATITQGSTAASQLTSAIFRYADSPSGPWTNVATVSLSGATQATVSVPNGTGAHRCWDWLANSNLGGGSGWNVAESTLIAPSAPSAMVLQSATLASAVSSPSAMRLLVQVDSTSAAFTPNTDLVVKMSRDGATTFTAATLGLVQSMPDGTVIYDTGWLSVTGQPAGNSTMTYLITTPTQKAIVLTGVSMQVRP